MSRAMVEVLVTGKGQRACTGGTGVRDKVDKSLELTYCEYTFKFDPLPLLWLLQGLATSDWNCRDSKATPRLVSLLSRPHVWAVLCCGGCQFWWCCGRQGQDPLIGPRTRGRTAGWAAVVFMWGGSTVGWARGAISEFSRRRGMQGPSD